MRAKARVIGRPQRWLIGITVPLMCGAARADEGLLRADLGQCALESGQSIEDCVVAYRVKGKLNQGLRRVAETKGFVFAADGE